MGYEGVPSLSCPGLKHLEAQQPRRIRRGCCSRGWKARGFGHSLGRAITHIILQGSYRTAIFLVRGQLEKGSDLAPRAELRLLSPLTASKPLTLHFCE